MPNLPASPPSTPSQTISRVILGVMLFGAGVSHLTVARQSFRAQVPPWVPMDPDLVVLLSGGVEIVLGLALLVLFRSKAYVGLVVALFFVAIFPGNIAQYTEHRSAFGLDTDTARLIRLLFQPVFVGWALWCSGAYAALRSLRERTAVPTL